MRIAQVSDFHFTHLTWNPLHLFCKRFFGNWNWVLSRKESFSPKHLAPLPQIFSDLKVDLVLLGGDFTTTALPKEFRTAKEWTSQILQPWIAIPGNHDYYTYRSYRLKRYYRYFPNPSLEQQRLSIHPLSSEWTLIALDTARPTPPQSSQGIFSEQLEKKLETALKEIDTSILLFNHYPFFQNDLPQRSLERGEALETLLKHHPKVRLYLHGHTHRHTIADLQPGNFPVILDSGSAAQGIKGSWNLIDLKTEGCTITGYRWDQKWHQLPKEEIQWKR